MFYLLDCIIWLFYIIIIAFSHMKIIKYIKYHSTMTDTHLEACWRIASSSYLSEVKVFCFFKVHIYLSQTIHPFLVKMVNSAKTSVARLGGKYGPIWQPWLQRGPVRAKDGDGASGFLRLPPYIFRANYDGECIDTRILQLASPEPTRRPYLSFVDRRLLDPSVRICSKLSG